ncbi:hypothetical protein HDU79_002810 [Rhizoclosmatium sp. JEL0117]|nr:hypothetical protein HDU79_002810 [Rhizoclosmatium sp. JEL0117]
MHDTRGGFLLSDQPDDLSQLANSDLRQPLRSSDPLPNDAMCVECESVDVCADLFKHYGVVVCRKCRDEFKDKYSLLTKTECREDYLLTESELRDTEKLPYWVKKNPHKDSYANMLLYLRMHVEAFAIAKWGSLEKLDQEFAKREEEKSVRKKKKFENKLVELRKKTLTSTWRRPEKDHVHEFGEKFSLFTSKRMIDAREKDSFRSKDRDLIVLDSTSTITTRLLDVASTVKLETSTEPSITDIPPNHAIWPTEVLIKDPKTFRHKGIIIPSSIEGFSGINSPQIGASSNVNPVVIVISAGAAVVFLALAGFAIYINKTNRDGRERDHEAGPPEIQMHELNDIAGRASVQSSPHPKRVPHVHYIQEEGELERHEIQFGEPVPLSDEAHHPNQKRLSLTATYHEASPCPLPPILHSTLSPDTHSVEKQRTSSPNLKVRFSDPKTPTTTEGLSPQRFDDTNTDTSSSGQT